MQSGKAMKAAEQDWTVFCLLVKFKILNVNQK